LNDVLVFGKGEADRLEFNPSSDNIVEFCAEIVEDIKASQAKNHDMQFSSSMITEIISFDAKLVRQIITNLMTNAVKYSPEGSTILVKLKADDQYCSLLVEDKGIGIPESDQPHLFEPFHRARNTGDIQGTGLGLAIMKKAVDLHGGEILVESIPDEATCFKVILPIKYSEAVNHD
jgi:signal transduction histidine kinase